MTEYVYYSREQDALYTVLSKDRFKYLYNGLARGERLIYIGEL